MHDCITCIQIRLAVSEICDIFFTSFKSFRFSKFSGQELKNEHETTLCAFVYYVYIEDMRHTAETKLNTIETYSFIVF